MTLTPNGYALLGLTALVACLVSILTFAMLRLASAARGARRNVHGAGAEQALLSAAVQEAVTKLKAQERATAARAEASERLSDEIISSLTAGLMVVGVNREILIVNPAGRRMLDLSEPPMPAGHLPSLREEPLLAVVDECMNTAAPIVRRTVVLSNDGEAVIHLGVTVSPLFDEDGKPHGAICLFTDLTSVKDLEEQLRLKDSLATLGELTAGIAHEFRNGLATIRGYSKLFDLQALPEAYRPYVEGIRAETQALSEVVTNFLNFARPAQLVLSRVELGGICERAAEEVRPDARALGGHIEMHGEFGELDGDEVLLRQAFTNLLRNAVEACVGLSRPPRIVIRSDVDRVQNVCRIFFNDNGPGVAPELRETVFRPFFTSKRSGTGLGLALVQKIIVFHNGRVTIGSSPSGGASLQITLPTTA
jgi:PAS domain S-box-containing protein